MKIRHVSDPIFREFISDVEFNAPKVKMLTVKRKNLPIMQAILAFKLENLFGARFACISCHKMKFGNGVKRFYPNMFPKVDIESFVLTKYFSDTQFQTCGSLWICHTCFGYVSEGKMPPISAANRLECSNLIDVLKLTEIENALLAPIISFMKVIKLPTSRMPALRDRVVNVPIPLSKINANIETLPRTIDEAKIIPVAIKRKRAFIQNYIEQFINPSKMLKAINILKINYPPYCDLKINYRKLANLINQSFKDSCEEHIVATENENLNVEDEILLLDDNIACFQPIIDSHIVLLPENLEEHVNAATTANLNANNCTLESDQLVFAPGEGETPVNILKTKHPFVLQFPALFPDGLMGFNDEERKFPVSISQFVSQRLLNVNSNFRRNKTFLFAALYMLELSQLFSKINLAYTQGSFKKTDSGKKFFKVQDSFQIFNDIPGSMKYLQSFKFDNIARIEQKGKPTLFYTTSFPNLRWPEIVATIVPKKFTTHFVLHELEEKNVDINQFLEDVSSVPIHEDIFYADEDELIVDSTENLNLPDCSFNCFEEKNYFVHHLAFNCFNRTCINCHLHPDCHRIDLASFLDNLPSDMTRSKLHGEFILDSVKIFNHKMKSFRKLILTSETLPFKINTYCDRVEFQLRGFPHVHGIGWGDLDEIDTLSPGFKAAFEKLNHFEPLSVDECKALTNYADKIISCSSSIDDIMSFGLSKSAACAVQAKILDCNVHKHTATCQKKWENLPD